MSKPFDATTKELLEAHPEPWTRLLLGTEMGQVIVLNADLTTITSEADKVLRIEGPEPWLVHVEFQASHDGTLPLRLQRYNVLLQGRHGLPVQSIAVLLRPEADGPGLTGLLEHRLPGGWLYHQFRYKVVRIWELPLEEVMAAGVGTCRWLLWPTSPPRRCRTSSANSRNGSAASPRKKPPSSGPPCTS
jgi:hypothetical protein